MVLEALTDWAPPREEARLVGAADLLATPILLCSWRLRSDPCPREKAAASAKKQANTAAANRGERFAVPCVRGGVTAKEAATFLAPAL